MENILYQLDQHQYHGQKCSELTWTSESNEQISTALNPHPLSKYSTT